MPVPVELPLPAGRPAELASLISVLAGAAFHAGVLDAHLSGPAASAPGWLGADSSAAAEQVGRTAALTRQVSDALTSAWHRLDAHRQMLCTVGGLVRVLWAAQDEDFIEAYARLAALQQQYGPDVVYGQAWSAVIADVTARERARAREHAGLLDEVTQDAADAARILIGACRELGGLGAPEDGGRVLAFLACQLPGWGAPELAELARQGSDVGAELRGASPDDLVTVLQAHASILAVPAFAASVVEALGPQALSRFVAWAGIAAHRDVLPILVGTLMGAADSVADRDTRIRATLEAPLLSVDDAVTAVGVGRIAAAPGFTAGYRAEMVTRLAAAERARATLRRDELLAAPAEDPLEEAMSGLATTAGASDAAAAVLADPTIWPGLLTRDWTNGTAGLSQLLRTAAGGVQGGDVAVVTLEAIGAATQGLSGRTDVGSGTVVFSIGPAVADVAVAHLDRVTGPVIAAEGAPGVAREPFDDTTLRQLTGLGVITRNLGARNTLIQGLIHRMQAGLPDPAPGQPAPEAYATGGLFAAMAFGERENIRQGLYSAVERADADSTAWSAFSTALSFLPVAGALSHLRDAVTTSMSFVGPGGVPMEAFFAQPQTGAFQASFAAVAATVPGLVRAGSLPHPGAALNHGLWTPEALVYEASLTADQRDLWDRVIDGAHEGYLAVGDGLGLLPGSSTGGK